MKIVVLDGHALNPGDLDWSVLAEFGDYEIFSRSDANDWFAHAQEAEVVLTNKVKFPLERIEQLPELKYIGVTATGVDIIDLEAARENNIVVTNVPAYSTDSVAQLVFALLLEITHQVGEHAHSVRQGEWAANPDFCYWKHPLLELSGLTMGVIGFGTIGQRIAQIAQAFGMKVIAYNRSDKSTQFPDIKFLPLESVLQESNVVSLSCPLTEQTKHLINAVSLEQMKHSAILINTARGPLVDEEALADALKNNIIQAAGLDVLSQEPPAPGNPLFELTNCFITPHIAWGTLAARQRCMTIVTDNLRAFLQGTPRNVVS